MLEMRHIAQQSIDVLISEDMPVHIVDCFTLLGAEYSRLAALPSM